MRLLKMAYEAVDSRLKALISSEEMKWSFDSLLRKKSVLEFMMINKSFPS